MKAHDQDICQSCGQRSPQWTAAFPEVGIRRCAHCGSLTFFPHSALDLGSLYSPEYFQGGEYSDYQGHRRAHEDCFRRKWKLIQSLLPGEIRVFEMGCAYGFFVNYARTHGAKEAFGVDVSPEIIAKAQQSFGPHYGVVPAVPPFKYNCLVAWDVWEHLEQPLTTMGEKIAQLEPGGLFAFTTVDSSSFVARTRGSRWRQIHPPTHMHYPTYHALEMGMKHLGLEVVHHSHFAQSRALEMYLDAVGMGRWFPKIEWLRKLPVPLNLFDIQLIIARKK